MLVSRPEKDPEGVGGATEPLESEPTSSSSGEERSTSGEGESWRRRSASASSERDSVEEREGEMMERWGKEADAAWEGEGMGWWR